MKYPVVSFVGQTPSLTVLRLLLDEEDGEYLMLARGVIKGVTVKRRDVGASDPVTHVVRLFLGDDFTPLRSSPSGDGAFCVTEDELKNLRRWMAGADPDSSSNWEITA